MREFVIASNDAGQRLDKFLQKAVPALPPALLYKSLRTKRIKCNGKRCESAQKLQEGDVLQLYINDEFFHRPDNPFLAAPAVVDVVYEDEHILLANKPAGLVVHEDDDGTVDTLIHRIQHYLYAKKAYDPAAENSFAPALCNRIDRNTSGIVIAAKSFAALQILNEKIKNREIDKHYLCLVHGVLQPPNGTLTGWHTKDEANNRVTITPHKRPGAKSAVTRYQTLARRRDTSLLEIELLTGRTHQIRAHLAAVGHPLLGDTKYGVNRMNRDNAFRFQALCSYKVTFAFAADAGVLQYLQNRSFQIEPEKVPFWREAADLQT